jgi:hypothetical protein
MVSKSGAKGKLGRVIARRIFTEAGKPDRKVIVYLGTPRRHPRYIWECPFLIEGIGKPEIRSVGGGDSLQALLLAMQRIKQCIEQSEVEYLWMGWSELGTGIPLQVPPHGRSFEERLRPLIERESKRFWEAKFKSAQVAIKKHEGELTAGKQALARWKSDLKAWDPAQSAHQRGASSKVQKRAKR